MNHREKQTMEKEEPQSNQSRYEVLFILLSYLPLHDLLSTTRVCSSVRETVKNEINLWSNIFVEKPLSSRLSDEVLLRISSKAKGKVRSLVLRDCVRVTDDGLLSVVRKNPLITKLWVSGCTSLTPEGVIRAVQSLTLKSLRINGIYNINKHHLQTLLHYLAPQGNGAIDVEICPKCDEVKMVFDCSENNCDKKCRGCYSCVPRCEECRKCVEAEEIEETACLDVVCTNCWLLLPKCDMCNKPYCKRHVSLGRGNSLGFVCERCHDKFVEKLYDGEI